jgi:hypothetical protein
LQHREQKSSKGMGIMDFAAKLIGRHIRGSMLGLAILSLVAIATAARAQDAFTVNISEKEMLLEHPNDMMWTKYLMWDLGYQRMMNRNAPYIELQNAATSTSPITEFHLTIGDSRFNFAPLSNASSAVIAVGSTTPGFALTGSTVNSSDELVVTIGNGGLLPGQLVRFQLKLGVDPAFAATYAASFGASQPDYRTVLFDINSEGGSTPKNLYGPDPNVPAGSEDNATAEVLLGGKKSQTEAVADTTEDALDQAVDGQYRNNALRAYGASDNVNMFQLTGSAEVPEPGSIALALIGLGAGAVCRRGRRSA